MSRASGGKSAALFEGFLHKQGHRRKNWKRRYFVLTNDALRYYTEPGGQLKGELEAFTQLDKDKRFNGMMDTARHIANTRGLSGFYTGYIGMQIRQCLWTGGSSARTPQTAGRQSSGFAFSNHDLSSERVLNEYSGRPLPERDGDEVQHAI